MTCPLDIHCKRPVDVLDYDIDYSRWLAEGDSVIAATAAVTPPESMVSAVQVIPQAETVKVWTADGVSGKTASIVVTATTAQGRVKQVEFQLRIKD